MLLAAEHLSINFGTRQLLQDVNFYLEEGMMQVTPRSAVKERPFSTGTPP